MLLHVQKAHIRAISFFNRLLFCRTLKEFSLSAVVLPLMLAFSPFCFAANENCRVNVSVSGGILSETYQVKQNSTWQDVLAYQGLQMLPAVTVIWDSVQQGSTIIINGHSGALNITRKITITEYGARIENTIQRGSAYSFTSCEDRYRFIAGALDFIWSQSIKNQASNFIPHWQFKSPAVIFQHDAILASIVAGKELVNTQYDLWDFPTAFDLGNNGTETPWFSYGIMHNKLSGFHSIYSRNTAEQVSWNGQPLSIVYDLILSGNEQTRQGYRQVVRYLWHTYGHQALLDTPDAQADLFDTWGEYTWQDYAQELYHEFNYGGEQCSTINTYASLGWPTDGSCDANAGFNAWFQALRSAYGMYLYGTRNNDAAIKQQARGVLNLILHAPQNQGAFPTVYWHGTNGTHHWQNDNSLAGYSGYYHVFDMAWTCYWMLKWHTDLTPDETRILPFCTAFGDFLVRKQNQQSGVIPAWFDSSLNPKAEFSSFNAETAAAALFLAELYAVTNNTTYRSAAEKALTFIENEVLPRHRWFDYETFLSCSPKSYNFYDSFTQQYPQNNMSTIQASQAYLRMYQITGNAHYLDIGQQVADYLALTQQIAGHPLMTPELIGGFTTQNTDAEWSDARQGYAATLYLDYYETTGSLEYLERGIAALRATFAVAPYENWAHNGSENTGGALTGFHWGTGSAMTSVEIKHQKYRDAYINIPRGHGAGVNACTLTNLSISANLVSFHLTTNSNWDNPAVVVIEGASMPMQVVANGQSLGVFSIAALLNGVSVNLAGIIVTSPAADEDWVIGTTRTVEWTSSGITENVKIELGRPSECGYAWSSITGSTSNDGTHSWTVQAPAQSNCRIKVTSLNNTALYDESEPFDIVSATSTTTTSTRPTTTSTRPTTTTTSINHAPSVTVTMSHPYLYIHKGDAITVTASASDTDTGDTLTYTWYVGKRQIAFGEQTWYQLVGSCWSSSQCVYTSTDYGFYIQFKCVVKDRAGATAEDKTLEPWVYQ